MDILSSVKCVVSVLNYGGLELINIFHHANSSRFLICKLKISYANQMKTELFEENAEKIRLHLAPRAER